MANTALRFFRGANAPATPAMGMIWFNTSLNLIQVYNGSEWEKYGKVQDVTFSDLKLNVKKSDGTEFTLDFSDVASANGVNASFADLKSGSETISIKGTPALFKSIKLPLPYGS